MTPLGVEAFEGDGQLTDSPWAPEHTLLAIGCSYRLDAKGYVNYDQSASWFYQATGSPPAMVRKNVA